MRALNLVGLVTLISTVALGQSPSAAAPRKFETADVHTAPSSPYQSLGAVLYRNGRYEFRNATLLSLVTTAYSVDPDKVVDGPAWIVSERFDVIAKVSPDATADTLNSMLRTLLADRFNLAVHDDSRPMPTYALVPGDKTAGDNPLRKASGGGPGTCKAPAAGGRGGQRNFTDVNGNPTELGPGSTILYECRNMTMPAFTEPLRKMSFQDFGNNPLVDRTGLEGAWDFDLTYSMMRGPDMSGIHTIFAGVSQLGLKLQPTKAPMPVVVVDRVNRTPSANPANLEQTLPPRSTEYESVQLSSADAAGNMGGVRGQSHGGRVDLRGQTLQSLISLAWNLTPDQVVGGPDFLAKVRPEMVAQAPVTTTPGLRQVIDQETNRIMLQNMLKTRFKLESHQDERTMDVFVLSAPEPKLTKASGTGRSGCMNLDANGKELKSFGMMTERHISCLNMTMAQFAAAIPGFAANMFMGLPRVVVNETEMEGTWDFSFLFTGFGAPPGRLVGGLQQPSLPDALAAQFGLKLEVAKRTQPVIVVDHVEEKPTEK